jgi:hypothetical protein
MGTLRLARRSKIEKYSKLLPDLQERLNATKGEVLPIVVGTRGAVAKELILALEKLHITGKANLLTMALTALRRSIKNYSCFMDYNAHLETEIPPNWRTSGT